MELSGAEIIIKLLERQGIETIAGIPGGANLPLYDALSQSEQIRHVLTRHEQGAGFIAQGMARVTGGTCCFLCDFRSGSNQYADCHCRREARFHPCHLHHRAGPFEHDRD